MFCLKIKNTAVFVAALTLSACGLFSEDKIHLEGQRISVMQGVGSLVPDFAPGEHKIKLPIPMENKSWTQNGGNSEHLMGHLLTKGKLKEVWNSGFGEGSSKRDYLIASPVIDHQVIFTIDAEAKVSAFRLDNGKRIWKRRLKPLIKDDKSVAMKGAGLAVYDKMLYATTGFGGVFGMDMISGKKLWRYDTPMPIRIAPTVNNGKVFAQTINNTLIALDAKTGAELWTYKGESEVTTLVGGASPAYNPALDVVIAAFSTGEIRAFKASTGTPLWGDMLISRQRTNSLDNITAVKASPVIDNDRVFAVGHNNMMAALDLRSGERIWEKEIGSSNQPWVAGKYVFVLTNSFDLVAMEKDSGKVIWNTNIPVAGESEDKLGVFASGPVLTSDSLLVTTSNGYAFSVSPYTGMILSYVSMPDGVELSPVVADAITIFTTKDAEIVAYK